MKKKDSSSNVRLLRALTLSERLIVKRLERALHCEEEIDTLLSLCGEYAKEMSLSEKERKELFSRVEALRCEDLSKLVAMIGMLCEKKAILAGAEEGEGGAASAICRFEDL